MAKDDLEQWLKQIEVDALKAAANPPVPPAPAPTPPAGKTAAPGKGRGRARGRKEDQAFAMAQPVAEAPPVQLPPPTPHTTLGGFADLRDFLPQPGETRSVDELLPGGGLMDFPDDPEMNETPQSVVRAQVDTTLPDISRRVDELLPGQGMVAALNKINDTGEIAPEMAFGMEGMSADRVSSEVDPNAPRTASDLLLGESVLEMTADKDEQWLDALQQQVDTSLVDVPIDHVGGIIIWAPEKGAQRPVIKLEDELLSRKLVDLEKLQNARTVQATAKGKSLTAILLDMGAIGEEVVQKVRAELLGIPYEHLDPRTADRQAIEAMSPDFCKAHGCVAIARDEGVYTVAMVDPCDIFLQDEIKRRLNVKRLDVVVGASNLIVALIDMSASGQGGEEFDDILKQAGDEQQIEVVREDKEEEITDLAKASGESPVIRLVNYVIFDAIKQGASDIHIEPHEKKLLVRYRIDGVLFDAITPPFNMMAPVVSRMKIMANLDISERRLPQDGRIRTMVNGRHVDLRVSTLPVTYGEKTVIRILDNRSISLGLEQLGFNEDMLIELKKQIDRPNGVILVTGPTGSGKTTTLYSSLRELDSSRLNVSTVEDPVEYHLNFANQVQVQERIGMTFAAALRSLLRQDPDVIMLGEIRDQETAHIAIQAALTGHLVLSTLHTNDAPSSVTRLINIGVEPYLISAALNAVLAQRLVRRICKECRELMPTEDPVMRKYLETMQVDPDKVYHGKGCSKCRNTGYKGRVGIYEMLLLDDSARDMIVRSPDVNELRKMCRERGMVTLRQDGFSKVMQGSTTVEEVLGATEATT